MLLYDVVFDTQPAHGLFHPSQFLHLSGRIGRRRPCSQQVGSESYALDIIQRAAHCFEKAQCSIAVCEPSRIVYALVFVCGLMRQSQRREVIES